MPKKAKKEKKKKAPTMRQKKTFELAMENNGNISKAMLAAGYSPATAKNPHLLKETDGWKELMKSVGLDDSSLLRKHKELLESSSIDKFVFDCDIPDAEIYAVFAQVEGVKVIYIRPEKSIQYDKKGKIDPKKTKIISKTAYIRVPDKVAQDKALDKAYRLNGSYKQDEQPTGLVAVQINNLLGQKKDEYGI